MKLSVITINLDNCAGLRRTMQSVFAQSLSGYEYIIIDGGSVDGSKEYINAFGQRLAYWVSEPDMGVYNAMNKGIARATGEYVLFLNSGDCFCSNDSLERLMSNAKEDIIYGNIMVEEATKSWLKTYPAHVDFEYFLHDSLPHPASLIRRSLFNNISSYNELNKIVSDWEFFMSAICLHGATYNHVDAAIACFNYDGMSSVNENASLIKNEKEFILNKYYNALLPKNRSQVPSGKNANRKESKPGSLPARLLNLLRLKN